MNDPGRLVCALCGLEPGGTVEISMLAEHFIAEHPEACDITGKPQLQLMQLGPDETWPGPIGVDHDER
jgi:hypothetical protein